ncbi:AAA family ATPase [Candidatus Bathyarchaeota archaeon]|nr:AAA family ATPase [Candidatus Bathyarchaeota archaeon]MBS7631089.1 AAA family ATPase [Candidatus Bathyarchaeota archaeon]
MKEENSLQRREKSKFKELVVTVSGLHGTGKSTQAKKLAEYFGLRYVSTGTIFREMARERGASLEEMLKIAEEDPAVDKALDSRTREESLRRGVVIDASLSAWMAVNPDIKILLTAPLKARVKRIADRESLAEEEALRKTLEREESDRKRYKEYYRIDINDTSIYDLVLNTELFSPDSTARILKKIIEEYSRSR